ncbi:MAG: DUF2997 domain-containing protein [bacterium]|nr:DUF2997 domain-containing protein [Candidatus Sumerlaeota bacterium]
MKNHDIEIEITKDGKVHATIRGAKGKGCASYAKLLEQIVGRIQSQQPTAEFYEPDTVVQIKPTIETRQTK